MIAVANRRSISFVALAVALPVLAVLSLGIGAVSIGPIDVLTALIDPESPSRFNIVNYRLPRMLCALLAGAALAVAGAGLQAALRNELASPDVVGIAKGSGLGAVLAIMVLPGTLMWLTPVAAIIGGLAAWGVLLLFSGSYASATTLALTGIAVGAIFHAVTTYILVAFPTDTNQSMIWLAGSLYGVGMNDVELLGIVLLVILPAAVWTFSKMDLLRLGEESIFSLGYSPRLLRSALATVCVFMAGVAVATVGAVTFLGLLAPHIASSLVGQRPRHLIPAAALCGGILLMAADLLGRVIAVPSEIPAGVVTAVIGSPYLIYLLFRSSRVA